MNNVNEIEQTSISDSTLFFSIFSSKFLSLYYFSILNDERFWLISALLFWPFLFHFRLLFSFLRRRRRCWWQTSLSSVHFGGIFFGQTTYLVVLKITANISLVPTWFIESFLTNHNVMTYIYTDSLSLTAQTCLQLPPKGNTKGSLYQGGR